MCRNKLKIAILKAWLIAGSLDILAASLLTLLNERSPLGMLKFIASGVFDSQAFQEGEFYSVVGLGFHYIIALGWTLLFFLSYSKIPALSKSAIATGIGYGILVWMGMNLIVLPLSNIPQGGEMSLRGVLTGITVLIVCIGFPLSFIAKSHYNNCKEMDKQVTKVGNRE